ncbi:hypothetical protein AL013_00175 [Mariprofundus ferrooxydans]|uniref:Response regulatory domain-containing protein n=2 Tax=Mariprofundus ferrooxydans TaxID=314344 RepID=Q0EZ37_9PROT|nr:hypothetical protein SPV1_07826 [Mariprofundus ferrooxydans PV-1]KON48804.1 hypothetical protein AL013_00175 [Mariprofundus ferrooxydans]
MFSPMNDQRQKRWKKCLILTGDAHTGEQLAMLLESHGWKISQVHSDREAYERMLRENIDAVIADIDGVDLGGLGVLSYCHHHDRSIETYAVTPIDDGYRKKLARDLGGCRGYFYLANDSHDIDTSRGMAAGIAPGLLERRERCGV